jgi:hypothetical protein
MHPCGLHAFGETLLNQIEQGQFFKQAHFGQLVFERIEFFIRHFAQLAFLAALTDHVGHQTNKGAAVHVLSVGLGGRPSEDRQLKLGVLFTQTRNGFAKQQP